MYEQGAMRAVSDKWFGWEQRDYTPKQARKKEAEEGCVWHNSHISSSKLLEQYLKINVQNKEPRRKRTGYSVE